jgi:DNA-binding response OmpR family regulator
VESLGCHILLVEDEPDIATMYSVVLKLYGHKVTVAGDGQAGLDAATGGAFDLVFLDIRLPKLDGIAVLDALASKGLTDTLPVVMLTNYHDPRLRDRALELGARDYLIKSSTMPRDLAARVPTWVDCSGTPN